MEGLTASRTVNSTKTKVVWASEVNYYSCHISLPNPDGVFCYLDRCAPRTLDGSGFSCQNLYWATVMHILSVWHHQSFCIYIFIHFVQNEQFILVLILLALFVTAFVLMYFAVGVDNDKCAFFEKSDKSENLPDVFSGSSQSYLVM